jgi:hypothetical protein
LQSKQPITAETVDSIVNRTTSRVQVDAEARPKMLVDLAADIRAAGYDFQSFERTIKIDRSILDCLIDRLVNPATLPARLVAAVSDALMRTADEFRDLRPAPTATCVGKSIAR